MCLIRSRTYMKVSFDQLDMISKVIAMGSVCVTFYREKGKQKGNKRKQGRARVSGISQLHEQKEHI